MKKPQQASATNPPEPSPSSPPRRLRGAERDLDPYAAVVGKRIKELRGDRSLTQSELATRAGLQLTTIFSVESGLQYLTLKTLIGIARGLDVEPADLLPRTRQEPDQRVIRSRQPEGEAGRRLEDLDTVLAEIDRLVQLARTMRTTTNPYGRSR